MKDENKKYLRIAREISYWSKDPSSKIGAIIVGEYGQIISQGYNGFPRKVNDTPERLNDRETKYKFVVHAEVNAICNAIHNGSKTNNTTLYVYGQPVCNECAKMIIQSGIKKVVMYFKVREGQGDWSNSHSYTKLMFDEANVEYEYFEGDLDE